MSTKTCKTCGVDKPVDDFSITDKARQYRYPHCKPCTAEKKRQERQAAPATYNAYQRDYYQRTREARLPQAREANARAWRALKDEIFTLLGGRCVRCGQDDARLLQVDHVEGGGTVHRMRVGAARVARQVRNELRAGSDRGKYQLLCANCHTLKTYEACLV